MIFDRLSNPFDKALIMASVKGYTEIVRLILDIGAKFDLREQVGSREED